MFSLLPSPSECRTRCIAGCLQYSRVPEHDGERYCSSASMITIIESIRRCLIHEVLFGELKHHRRELVVSFACFALKAALPARFFPVVLVSGRVAEQFARAFSMSSSCRASEMSISRHPCRVAPCRSGQYRHGIVGEASWPVHGGAEKGDRVAGRDLMFRQNRC